MITVLKDIKNLRGQSYGPGDRLPDEVWAVVPERNRRAMKNLRMVTDGQPVLAVRSPEISPAPLTSDMESAEPVKRKRGRPRKVPVPE